MLTPAILNIIFPSMIVLGIIIILIGVAMFMLRTCNGKSNIVQGHINVKFNDNTFSVDGASSLIVTFVGFCLLGTPTAIVEATERVRKSDIIAEGNTVDESDVPKNADIEFHRIDMTIDLRNRKQIPAKDKFLRGAPESVTSRYVEAFIKPTTAEKIHFSHGTSGKRIDFVNASPQTTMKNVYKKGKVLFYSPLQLFSGDNTFTKDQHIKAAGLNKNKLLSIPISNNDEEQKVFYELNYVNSFQGKKDEWAGYHFLGKTDKFTARILLPDNKPVKSFVVRYGNPQNESSTFIEIKEPNIQVTENGTLLTWRIEDAKKDMAYIINLNWEEG